MLNIKKERDVAMRKAYAFAREGNGVWAQKWIDRASDFFPVDPQQLAYANKLLKTARDNQYTAQQDSM